VLLSAAAGELRPGGVLLLRDCGLYDMRHLRDAARGATPVDTAAFLRPGGMHRRYYSLADVDRLAAAAGLEVVESRYLCVRLTNQRRGVHMDRVYVHAVLRRPVGHSRRLLHANSRLRIFDERLGPDCTASVHHAVPAVRWQVLDASQPTPSPFFHAAGFTATVRNVSPHERRDICFEVLGEPLHGEEEVARRLAAPRWPTAPGQRLMLENALVRMWDFRASLGMDRLAFHQHVFDNAWVVLGDGAALNVYTPVAGGGAKLEKTVHFHDGFVSWTVVRNGGFDADGEPLAPTCLHSVDSAVPSVEFREYLIELK